ncbi:MAG: sulfatase [Candidatus Zipacnadales bacterium]
MRVILVNADTFRRDHLGAYGNKWIRTPNLDTLAAESTLFERHYIGSFPTVPNRRDTFLGLGDKGVPFNRWKAIDNDEVTLPERLSEAGIHSMMVTDTQNTVTRGINLYKGFSAWTCNRGQEADPCWSDATVSLQWPVPPELIRYRAEWWYQILQTRAHRKVETDWFAPHTYQLAIEWLQQNYLRERFFLYIDTFDPHEPWDPPPWYEHMYDPTFKGRRFDAPTYGFVKKLGITPRELQNIRARYAGEVTMVDACMGRLIAALHTLGLWDDTLLIFTSDHGAYFGYPGDNGMICKAHMLGDDGRIMAAGKPAKPPLHYYPHWTGVARIPLIVHLPGQTRAVRLKTITQPWDIAPTILDAFGIGKPAELWGDSLIPLIQGTRKKIRDAAVMGNPAHAQVMTAQWLYAVWRGQRPKVLYDLKADPEQKRDVSAKYPEVVKRLHKYVAKYLQRQGMEELLPEYV